MSELYPMKQMIEDFSNTMQQFRRNKTESPGSQEESPSQQVLNRFGLKVNPFSDSVNPDFFYASFFSDILNRHVEGPF